MGADRGGVSNEHSDVSKLFKQDVHSRSLMISALPSSTGYYGREACNCRGHPLEVDGLGAWGVTGMAAAAPASHVTAYWADIWRVLRGE
jgi:hypothetical protein